MSGHGTSALDGEATAEALSRYRGQASRRTLAGLVPLTVNLGALWLSRRMRKQLASRPWTACAAVSTPRGLYGASIVLKEPTTGALMQVAPMATVRRYALVDPSGQASDGALWWCGDPRTGGVISPPGGGELVWAGPIRDPLRRWRAVRDAERRGLPTRPAPEPAPSAPLRVSLAKSPPPRPATPAPAPVSPAPVRTRRRWVFRWVLLVGLAALGLGIAGSVAAYNDDPQIDLTVVKEAPDGTCVVTWKDPWTGTKHRGPYHCDPDRDPLLADWETGWVVSYGPWKGDLYDSRWRGSVADDVNDGLALGGLVVTVIGAGGGITRVVRRRRARREAATPYQPYQPQIVPFTFAALAAEAEHQYLPEVAHRRPPQRLPERDIREVPWWRVRSLRELSFLNRTLMTLGGIALVYPAWMWGEDDVHDIPVMGVACAVIGLWSLYRFLRSGLATARRLTRAARAPRPVPKRYVLLSDPYTTEPLLLFFAPDAGDEDPPEGALLVARTEANGQPGTGLTLPPTGAAELHGWLDDRPTVVPWIEGRAVWPLEPYEELDASDSATRTRWTARPAPGPAARRGPGS